MSAVEVCADLSEKLIAGRQGHADVAVTCPLPLDEVISSPAEGVRSEAQQASW